MLNMIIVDEETYSKAALLSLQRKHFPNSVMIFPNVLLVKSNLQSWQITEIFYDEIPENKKMFAEIMITSNPIHTLETINISDEIKKGINYLR